VLVAVITARVGREVGRREAEGVLRGANPDATTLILVSGHSPASLLSEHAPACAKPPSPAVRMMDTVVESRRQEIQPRLR
jgi:hypothetical protein